MKLLITRIYLVLFFFEGYDDCRSIGLVWDGRDVWSAYKHEAGCRQYELWGS